ncbi:class III signal peptide-containing protein [archaeon]|nr:class III signal peptide-containing protein [archaeon]
MKRNDGTKRNVGVKRNVGWAKAQGSLEYLILIAVVLAVAAFVVLFVTGAFGGQQSSALLGNCRQAASTCKLFLLSSPNDPCVMCREQCQNPSTGLDLIKPSLNLRVSDCVKGDGSACGFCKAGDPAGIVLGGGGGDGGGGGGTQNQQPTISVSSPSSCSLNSACAFTASAADADGTVSSIAWTCSFVSRTGAASDCAGQATVSQGGASYSVQTGGTNEGTISVTATATDNQGAQASAVGSARVIAGTTNQPPTLSVAPPSFCGVNTQCTFVASASDPEGGTVSISWTTCTLTRMSGNTLIRDICTGTVGSGGTTYTVTPSNTGTLSVRTVATDPQGASTQQDSSVTVSSTATMPPIITIAPPSSCTVNTQCTFTASASDPDGGAVTISWTACTLMRMSGNTLIRDICTGTVGSGGTTYTVTPSNTGTLSVTANATDTSGANGGNTSSVSVSPPAGVNLALSPTSVKRNDLVTGTLTSTFPNTQCSVYYRHQEDPVTADYNLLSYSVLTKPDGSYVDTRPISIGGFLKVFATCQSTTSTTTGLTVQGASLYSSTTSAGQYKTSASYPGSGTITFTVKSTYFGGNANMYYRPSGTTQQWRILAGCTTSSVGACQYTTAASAFGIGTFDVEAWMNVGVRPTDPALMSNTATVTVT